MDPGAYREMSELEDHHWWFRAKRKLITPLLQNALKARERAVILDIGCGTGSNLALVEQLFPAARRLGLDLDRGALAYSRKRELGVHLLRGSGSILPLQNASVDCIVALDFIEHIEDDTALLSEFLRVLKPGGELVASVPRYPWLWSPHDEFLHHKRRYSSGELEQRLGAAGFKLLRRQGFNFLLLPAIAAVRIVKRLQAKLSGNQTPATDFGSSSNLVNALLAPVFAIEALCVRLLPITAGVSLMVRAAKPDLPR